MSYAERGTQVLVGLDRIGQDPARDAWNSWIDASSSALLFGRALPPQPSLPTPPDLYGKISEILQRDAERRREAIAQGRLGPGGAISSEEQGGGALPGIGEPRMPPSPQPPPPPEDAPDAPAPVPVAAPPQPATPTAIATIGPSRTVVEVISSLTKNQKIAIGLGAGAVLGFAYYLGRKS